MFNFIEIIFINLFIYKFIFQIFSPIILQIVEFIAIVQFA